MKHYAFSNMIVLVDGFRLTHWDEGDDVIKVEFNEDQVMTKVGADGMGGVAISANRSGTFTFKLMANSPGNQVLNKAANLQRGDGTFAPIFVQVQDRARQDVGTGQNCVIVKQADFTRGAGVPVTEWKLWCERLDLLLGNPVFAGAALVAAEAVQP